MPNNAARTAKTPRNPSAADDRGDKSGGDRAERNRNEPVTEQFQIGRAARPVGEKGADRGRDDERGDRCADRRDASAPIHRDAEGGEDLVEDRHDDRRRRRCRTGRRGSPRRDPKPPAVRRDRRSPASLRPPFDRLGREPVGCRGLGFDDRRERVCD